MKKSTILFGLVFTLFISVTSCKDDAAPSGSSEKSTGLMKDADKAKLFDKVWYSTSSSGGIEHEFLTDGTFRLSVSLEGRWTWVNNSDTMDILDYTNTRYKYVFKSIGSSTMSYSSSFDGYKNTYDMRDTE
ncbi:MAG: hypothetical protein ACI8ZN_000671 [Bacteroidia bacterium]|jgi:hypothetical protein